jgi:pimeloyl-ACP methyl ester carboxylesterase
MIRHYLRVTGESRLAVDVGGDPSSPALLLLHGFPSSARTFRRLAPMLVDDLFVVAPDLPGFGESEVLASTSFEAMGNAVLEVLDHFSVGPRFIYLHDFGAPVGFHVAMHAPALVTGLIIQNANAHTSGFGPQWADTIAYWSNPTPENEAAATAHLTWEGIRNEYVGGVPDDVAKCMAADNWDEDWRVMSLPGRLEAQRALVADYGNYVRRFEEIQSYLQSHQPPALMVWGRHDPFFELAETLSWMKDLPRMDAHILDAGHMLLECRAEAAVHLILDFVNREKGLGEWPDFVGEKPGKTNVSQ